MTCCWFWDRFGFSFHSSGNKIDIVFYIPAKPSSTKLGITNAHLETPCGILQFSKQHQPQQTASYTIRWRRCARRMAHQDMFKYFFTRMMFCQRRVVLYSWSVFCVFSEDHIKWLSEVRWKNNLSVNLCDFLVFVVFLFLFCLSISRERSSCVYRNLIM